MGGDLIMQLGFLSACLPNMQLEEIVRWASENEFEALEVASWPALGDRPFTASHIDVETLTQQKIEEIQKLLAESNVHISSLAFYDNNLHSDITERKAINDHLIKCIDAAAALGVPTVGTFVGRDIYKTVSENLKVAVEVFKPLVDHASSRNVKIVIENCVMEGWHPDGYPGNLAYSPELWEWMFDQGLYLNYDPSHLMWMGIDPVEVIKPYIKNIAHAQAKDIELFPELRNRYGYPGKSILREDPWDVGWWRYRIPGRGEVNWVGVIDALQEGGFTGVLSVEHEDPVWGGTPEKVKQGLQIAKDTLEPLIYPGRLR